MDCRYFFRRGFNYKLKPAQHSCSTTGAVVNALWNINNDVYVGYNWIVNRSMKDLTGHSVGRKHAQDAAFTLATTILSLPLGGVFSEFNAAKRTTTVFRAVDAREAAIIKNTGKFSLQEGGVEAKYFAKSLEDAHWYGKRLYPDGYSIIQGTVKGSVNASQYWFPHVDIGAYVFPKQTLPYIIPH